MWHWRRYRSTLVAGYLCGAGLGAAAALMFIAPIDFTPGLMTSAIGALVGVVTVTFAVFGGWLMLVWRDPHGTKSPDRRVLLASLGATLGVFAITLLCGLVLMPRLYMLYIPFGVLSGIVTLIISSLVIARAEQRAMKVSEMRRSPALTS